MFTKAINFYTKGHKYTSHYSNFFKTDLNLSILQVKQFGNVPVEKNESIVPFLKWAGGKRQIMHLVMECFPKKITAYYEPFIGGGAVLFHFQPKKAVISDLNAELINVYNVIKYNAAALVDDLGKHENNPEYFYKIRSLDRTDEINKLTDIERASRVIYLNKTCYNGLYRVNKAGAFNTPFGRYKNPNIINEPAIKAVHKYLTTHNIQIRNDDYSKALKNIKKGAFVYLDPPYHPVSESANFTGYVQGGWNEAEQIRLKETCDLLHKTGVQFLLSNSATPFIKKLYNAYNFSIIKASRSINSNGKKRGEVDEVLVRNYQ